MKNDATATFLITTARSGTQWLATALRDAYPDLLRVEHEPVGYRYRPAANLRDREALDLLLTNPVVAAHFTTIDETLREGRSYVELGFPAFALYPLLRDRFADRLRIVQLVRHPVPVAASLVTHDWYTKHGRDEVRGTVALTPTSSGVLLRHYADRWPAMTAFERSLFYWYEVHAYGREVMRLCSSEDFVLVRFDGLIETPAARTGLLDFLRIPDREAFHHRSERTVDRYHHRTPEHIDVSLIERHPPIVALATELGFDPYSVTQEEIDARYREIATDRWTRWLRRGWARLRAR
jgi:hypothetical protein